MSEQEEKGTETSAVTPVHDDLLSALLMGSTWVERDDVGLRERTWEDMNEDERKVAMDELRRRSPLLSAVAEFGVPLTEAEREEAKERYGNWQDDKPAAVQDWWKDEKGEI